MKFVKELHEFAIHVNITCMIVLDPWYKYILNKVGDRPLKIKSIQLNAIDFIEEDDDGEYMAKAVEFVDFRDYDFFNDEVIEMERMVDPVTIIPQDNLRYSIINVLGYCIGRMLECVMTTYTKSIGSYKEGKKNMFIMKNEFLFKRMMLTEGKKNYATLQEVQEGNMIPIGIDTQMDIKGLPLNKSTVNETTQKALQKILYEQILTAPEIKQMDILKKLVLVEKDIYESLQRGSKEYYKPASVKSMNSYDDPMRISGIKASIVWNALHEQGMSVIDLEKRNSIDIVKVDISIKTIDRIKDEYPNIYYKMLELLNNPTFKGSINAVAIPLDDNVPEWLLPFIDYVTIMNDNIGNFKKPLEAVGIRMAPTGNSNYTNQLKI